MRYPLTIQKYGGSSVATAERIRSVARRVMGARRRGSRVVVVVSAMGDSTDELQALAADVVGGTEAAKRHAREMDMLLSAGERVSMALLAMAIREQGGDAVSFTGSQAAIITDGVHTAARVEEVRAERVREALAREQVPIIAGFQGVSRGREITTLGRGGSDTTAVALAVALDAERCEVYTDVRGIYTADPRRVAEARLIPEISFDEMLEMASSGAQVMHARAIEIASKYSKDVRVGSSFGDEDEEPGTLITRTPRRMEELAITGITSQAGQAKLVMRGFPAGMRTTAAVLVTLAEAGVSVDMIHEAKDGEGLVQLQLTVSEAQLESAVRLCEGLRRGMGGASIETTDGLSRLALVGSGMHERPGVYARAFTALLEEDIEVFAVSTSAISITLLVSTEGETSAVRALHQAFTLELPGGEAARAVAGEQ